VRRAPQQKLRTHRSRTASCATLWWAVPWLKRLVAGLLPRRLGFDPGSVHVGFVVDKVARTGFSPSTSVFPCQFHSTFAPLLGKIKKLIIFHLQLHHRVAQ
jgi:hypothetical protein